MNPRTSWPILSAALLAGCVSIPSRYASVGCICRADSAPVHQVSLQAPTGNWSVSGHGLALYREAAALSIRLPEMPLTQARYEATEVAVFDMSPHPPVAISVTGGHVLIDQKRKEITVSFQTPRGPFWANGTYPVR